MIFISNFPQVSLFKPDSVSLACQLFSHNRYETKLLQNFIILIASTAAVYH